VSQKGGKIKNSMSGDLLGNRRERQGEKSNMLNASWVLPGQGKGGRRDGGRVTPPVPYSKPVKGRPEKEKGRCRQTGRQEEGPELRGRLGTHDRGKGRGRGGGCSAVVRSHPAEED